MLRPIYVQLALVFLFCASATAQQTTPMPDDRPQSDKSAVPSELIKNQSTLSHSTEPNKNEVKKRTFVGAPANEPKKEISAEEKVETKEKRDDVAQLILVAERQVEKEQKQQDDKSTPSLPPEVNSDEVLRLRSLKQLDVMLAQRDQQTTTHDDTQKELADRTQELQNVKDGRLGFEPPYSFLMLDQLQDELSTLQSNLASSQLGQTLVNEDIVQAKKLLEQKEQAYRLSKDGKGSLVTSGLPDNSKEALEIKVATETLAYRKRRSDILKIRNDINLLRIQIVEGRIGAIQKEASFSEDDLITKKAEIEQRDALLRKKLSIAERDMEDSDSKWLSDRARLKSGAATSPKEVEELELRRLQRQSLQATVASVGFRLELLNQNREAWERRYQLANSLADKDQMIEYEAQAVKHLAQRDRDIANRLQQLDEFRAATASLETKIAAISQDEALRDIKWVMDLQKSAVRAKATVIEEEIASIQLNRRVTEKLLVDIRGASNRFSLASLWHASWYHTKNIWNAELTSVDERPITIGKVLSAFAIFLGGFWLSRIISRRMKGFLNRRLKVDESASAAFQSLAFYGMVMSFLLGALNFVSIPLTVFTFLGGALAIGVGFGSQNVLGNFISGLILLAERPVKVGDLIQMDEFYGNIELIGARSTVVRTGNNVRLIVPNSKFLENNVINLTHGANDLIRAKICVGVSYGSRTREVTKLLKQAANDHGLVVKDPEPFVLFKEFGDNSLNFELHFWVKVNAPLDKLKMESDVRYRIDSLFNEGGIVISFPQRDIHLDTSTPIDIRLLPVAEATIQQRREAA